MVGPIYCRNCKAQINANDTFCPKCGQDQRTNVAAPQTPAQPVQFAPAPTTDHTGWWAINRPNRNIQIAVAVVALIVLVVVWREYSAAREQQMVGRYIIVARQLQDDAAAFTEERHIDALSRDPKDPNDPFSNMSDGSKVLGKTIYAEKSEMANIEQSIGVDRLAYLAGSSLPPRLPDIPSLPPSRYLNP